MNGKQRRMVVWVGFGCLFLIIFFVGSTAMRSRTAPPTATRGAKVLNIEGDMLQKSKVMESQKDIADRDSKVAELQKQLDEITKEKAGQQQSPSQQPFRNRRYLDNHIQL